MKKTDQKINQKGFSTLEMLMAMFVLLLALTAVISVSFGNQSLIIDSQTNAEALNIAQGLLEKAQADSRKDFNLVNPVSEIETGDGFIYRVDVEQTGNFTKMVTAYVDFPEDSGRRGKTQLSTVVTNFNNAIGGDTCSSIFLPDAENWKNIDNGDIKDTFTPDDFDNLVGINVIYSVTDVDAYGGKLYVTVDPSLEDPLDDPAVVDTAPTFFTFDISDPDKIDPVSGGFIDNDPVNATGLNAVAVAEKPGTDDVFAYVASGIGDQLQVIKVSATPPEVVASLDVPGEAGNSIFYKDGYVYLGLSGSASQPEFYIIDVHDPLNPFPVGHWTKSNWSHDINAISVRDRYAYLATAGDNNLVVLNISNAASPVAVGEFDDGGGNNGKSIFLLGDVLYLGRTTIGSTGAGTELTVLDTNDLDNPITYNSGINASADGVIVRGVDSAVPETDLSGLVFLLTKREFRVFDAASLDAASIAAAVVSLPNTSDGDIEATMDCEGNIFFIGSNNNANEGYLSVIDAE